MRPIKADQKPVLARILDILKRSGPLSSEELSIMVYGRHVNAERNRRNRLCVTKSISQLRHHGYTIHSERYRGNGPATYTLGRLHKDCQHGEPPESNCGACLRERCEEESAEERKHVF